DQLHVEVAHVQHAPSGLANDGEGLDQKVVERGALGDAFSEFDRLGGQVDIGKLLKLRLEVVDGRNDGQHGFDFPFVLRSENFGQKGINHEKVLVGGDVGRTSAKSYFSAACAGDPIWETGEL